LRPSAEHGGLFDITRAYVRLREDTLGGKSGSRAYQMLSRRGPVETVRRMVEEPTEGLDFLAEHGSLDLAFETIALKREYRELFDAAEGTAEPR
jgi:hypothetical protein